MITASLANFFKNDITVVPMSLIHSFINNQKVRRFHWIAVPTNVVDLGLIRVAM